LESWYFFFFFFQAEDGIRDGTVTGVQTCALPIYVRLLSIEWLVHAEARAGVVELPAAFGVGEPRVERDQRCAQQRQRVQQLGERSEERRVGKECRWRGAPDH